MRFLKQRFLSPKNREEVYKLMNQHNMHSGVRAAVVILVAEFITFLNRILQWYITGNPIDSADEIVTYVCRGAFMMSAVFLLVVCLRYLKNKRDDRKLAHFAMMIFIIMSCSMGMGLAMIRDTILESLSIYMVLMVLSTCYFVINPIIVFIYESVYFVGFYFFLNRNSEDFTPLAKIVYWILWMAILIVSASRYNMVYNMAQDAERLKEVIRIDAGTGLKNRKALKEDYEETDEERKAAVFMMDMDDFQLFNDMYGSRVGDKLLETVAKALTRHFGKENVYRYGGDEYLIIYPIDRIEDPDKWIESMLKHGYDLQESALVDGEHYPFTVSTGYTYGSYSTYSELGDLMRMANRMLLRSKRSGKNRAMGEAFAETDENNLFQKIYKASEYDDLTGLSNMMHFRNRAQKILSEHDGSEQLCFIFFDIENFRLFNQVHGFEGGDQALKFFANVLRENFPEGLTARFNGDHFMALDSTDGIIDKVENIHEAMHDYKEDIHLETKAGIYLVDDYEVDASLALDKAKSACDSIKTKYDADFKFYDPTMDEEKKMEQYIIDHIDEALNEQWVKVFYQPVIRTITGQICGVEALARWDDPKYGLLSPGLFIDILERAHLITKLDCYIIEQACRDYRELADRGDPTFPISLNLSRLDFQLSNIFDTVNEIVNRYNVPKNLLHIEITESVLNDDVEFLKEQINRFHGEGYEVWMDDFGSGYSSLNTLKEYDFDVLKIDMIFLKNFDKNPKIRLILASIVNMAKHLGMQTLAEGVETPQHSRFLREIGCEKLQGYLFSSPAPLKEIIAFAKALPSGVETENLRGYYDDIGKVNLLSPDPLGNTGSWSMENALPIAMVECFNNKVKYITYNPAFVRYLNGIGIMSVAESEKLLCDTTRETVKPYMEAAAKCMQSGEEMSFDFVVKGEYCNVHGKRVAFDKATGKGVLLVVGSDYLVKRTEKPNMDNLSDEALLLWLSTRGFAEVMGYGTYDEFLENTYYFQVDLTDDRMGDYHAASARGHVREYLDSRPSYTECVHKLSIDMAKDEYKNELEAFYDRQKFLEEYKNGVTYGTTEYEMTMQEKNTWVHVNYQLNRGANGHVMGYFLCYDIESFRRRSNLIKDRAEKDELTGLYNRAYSEELMTDVLESPGDRNHIMILMDVDNFKTINDTHGHECGDVALQETAHMLHRVFGDRAIIGRAGGDEFTVLLQDTQEEDAIPLLKKMGEGNSFIYNYKQVKFTYSLGYSVYPENGESLTEVRRKADIALYRAKQEGKNTFVKYMERATREG